MANNINGPRKSDILNYILKVKAERSKHDLAIQKELHTLRVRLNAEINRLSLETNSEKE